MCLNRLGRLEIPGAVTGPPGPAGNQGPLGPAGPIGVGWIFGTSNPTDGQQDTPNGTLYLNTTSSRVFAFNSTTAQWSFVDSLQGTQGTQGLTGQPGPSGTSILTKYSTPTQTINVTNQTIVFNSYTASGNTLLGNDGHIAKIFVETNVNTNTVSATPYPHTIYVSLNSNVITNPIGTYTTPTHPLYFVPLPNSALAGVINFSTSFVEVVVQRNGIAPAAPNVYVRWGNRLNDSGYFRSDISASIDFSNPVTIEVGLISAPSGTFDGSRVTSKGWIEIYKTI
jgi:hypothetical protein